MNTNDIIDIDIHLPKKYIIKKITEMTKLGIELRHQHHLKNSSARRLSPHINIPIEHTQKSTIRRGRTHVH